MPILSLYKNIKKQLPAWRDRLLQPLSLFILLGGYAGLLLLAGFAGALFAFKALFAAGLLVLLALSLWLVRAEYQQRQLRRYWREALAASPDAHMLVDHQGKIILAGGGSMAMMPLLSRTPIATLRQISQDHIDSQHALDLLAQQYENRQSAQSIIKLTPTIGAMQWLQITIKPVGGRRQWWLWSFSDCTLSKQRQAELEAQHQRIAAILDGLQLGLYAADNQGRLTFCNETLAGWLQKTTPELMNNSDGNPQAPTYIKDIFEAPLPPMESSSSAIITLKQGIKQPMRLTWVKTPEGHIAALSDVNRQIQASSKPLSSRNLRFEQYFMYAPIGMVWLNPEGFIRESNWAFQKLIRTQQDDPLPSYFKDCLGTEEQTLFTAAFAQWQELSLNPAGQAEKSDDAVAIRTLELHLHPRQVPVSVSCHPLWQPQGEGGAPVLTGFILHVIDLTQRKAIQAEQAQTQRLQSIGRLAGGIAHDFNNLLTAILGYTNLLLEQQSREEPSSRTACQDHADLMEIHHAAERAAGLVQQLLAFSRQQPLKAQALETQTALKAITKMLERVLPETIDLTQDIADDPLWIRVDAGQFDQLLLNLVVNARDAMPEGGSIHLELKALRTLKPRKLAQESLPPGRYVVLTIRDTGSGIPAAIQDRIFDPFFTTKSKAAGAESPTHTKANTTQAEVGRSGTGLGLATVYGVLKQSGGFIDLESKLDQGTCFRLYFPQQPARNPSKAAPKKTADDESGAEQLSLLHYRNEDAQTNSLDEAASATSPEAPITILLAEDEAAVRQLSIRALEHQGYRVLGAEDGEAALAAYRQDPQAIDLVMTDMVMPAMDGPTLVKHLRASDARLPILCLSGYAEESMKEQLVVDENIHFMAKPFSLKDLLAWVNQQAPKAKKVPNNDRQKSQR